MEYLVVARVVSARIMIRIVDKSYEEQTFEFAPNEHTLFSVRGEDQLTVLSQKTEEILVHRTIFKAFVEWDNPERIPYTTFFKVLLEAISPGPEHNEDYLYGYINGVLSRSNRKKIVRMFITAHADKHVSP